MSARTPRRALRAARGRPDVARAELARKAVGRQTPIEPAGPGIGHEDIVDPIARSNIEVAEAGVPERRTQRTDGLLTDVQAPLVRVAGIPRPAPPSGPAALKAVRDVVDQAVGKRVYEQATAGAQQAPRLAQG